MIDIKIAIRTTLLLVDDDIDQLELRTLMLKMLGFTVLSASRPVDAISIMAHGNGEEVDVAVLDYHMPVMNGCILADYLKSRYPDMKTILYSAALDVLDSEMSGVDVFVSKSAGLEPLLAQVSQFAQGRATTLPSGGGDLSPFARALL